MKGIRAHSRLKRLEGLMRARRAGREDWVDTSQPMDPIGVAIMEELGSHVPLNEQPDKAMPEIVGVCVGRALVNADLSAEEIEELAPAYTELFISYFEEAREVRDARQANWGRGKP
jgi:hypothetical protein